jgi:hypothetical protein
MVIHFLALVPLGVVFYFWLTFEGLIKPLPFEIFIWLGGFLTAIFYSRLVARRLKKKLQAKRTD